MDEIYFYLGGQRGDIPFVTCATMKAFRFIIEALAANEEIVPEGGRLALVSYFDDSDIQSGLAILIKQDGFNVGFAQGAIIDILRQGGLNP